MYHLMYSLLSLFPQVIEPASVRNSEYYVPDRIMRFTGVYCILSCMKYLICLLYKGTANKQIVCFKQEPEIFEKDFYLQYHTDDFLHC